MARDSAVGRERILLVPSSLALDNTTTNQHVADAQNDLNQQILEVRLNVFSAFFLSNQTVRLNFSHTDNHFKENLITISR